LCFLHSGYAQQPYSIHINQANGLPSNAVYDVYQDKNGFIWFATQEGITRYDGAEFKTYNCEAQVSTAGSCIKEDKYGRIWYENFDGRLYYVLQDSLYALAQKSVFNYAPFAVTDNYLMLVQNTSIDIYDLKSLRFLKKLNIPSDINFFESSFAYENDLYFIVKDSIYHIDNNLKINTNGFLAGKGELIKRISVSDSVVFVSAKLNSNSSLYVFDRKLQNPRIIKISGPKLIQGASYIDGRFWMHTPDGSYSYPLNGQGNKAEEHLFAGKSISNLIKDRQGNYWFTSTSEGAFLMLNLEQKFFPTRDFFPRKIVKHGNAFLLANSEGSFAQFGPKENIVQTSIAKGSGISEMYYLFADTMHKDIIYSAKGMSFFPNGQLTKPLEYHAALKEIVRLDNQYYAFVANGFCALIKAPSFQKNLTSKWDSIYLRANKTHNNDYAVLVGNIRGRAIAYNQSNNTIYCSGNSGFFKINPNGVDTIKQKGIAFYASKILTFEDQLFALNTKGNLYKVEKDGTFILLNKQLGLVDNEIKYVRQFGSKILLMNNRYICYVDLRDLKHQILNINISPSVVNDLYLEKDKVYVVLKDGIVEANLNFSDNQKVKTIFHITGFKVNDIAQQQFQNKVFHHRQNDIDIRFSILDFGSVQTKALQYKLNNEDWKTISTENRNLQFKSLSPGEYSVAFKLGDEVLKEKVSFIIDAPFWMKWWFIMLCVTVVVIIIYSYYKWQISLLSRQIKLLREKVELEQSLGKSILTSIKSQMNPHFFYNALNTIQAYIFTNDKRNASVYLGKFSKLTRMILEMSEQELIPLQEEIQALTLYLELEKMRFDDDFDFELKIDYSVDVDMIKIPSMLIQPYAENAIKHGLLHRKGQKYLWLEMKIEGKYLVVTIDDNGIGRTKSEEMKVHKKEKHNSFSTRANEQRLEILNRNKSQKVVVEIEDKLDVNKNALGTKVRLFIPLEL
jgi:sensor histidine kinase YesM